MEEKQSKSKPKQGFTDTPDSEFVQAILKELSTSISLGKIDEDKWFASATAIDIDNEPGDESIAARFRISQSRQDIPKKEWIRPLFTPQKVSRDFAKPQKPKEATLDLVFTFIKYVPVSKNMELFKEFAGNEIRRWQEREKESRI